MDKIKMSKKEFDELYLIEKESESSDEPIIDTTEGKPEEEMFTAEELAQDKALEELS